MPWTRASPGVIERTPIRKIQAVGECRCPGRAAVRAELVQEDHSIAGGRSLLGWKGVFQGQRDPEPPRVVKCQVHWFVNVRLRGDKLSLEPGMQVEPLALLFRGPGFGGGHEFGRSKNPARRIDTETDGKNGGGERNNRGESRVHGRLESLMPPPVFKGTGMRV